MKRNRLQLYVPGWLATGLLLVAGGCTEADIADGRNPAQQQPATKTVETAFILEVAPGGTPQTRCVTFTAQGSTEADTLAVATPASSADTLQTRSATELPDAQEKKIAGLWVGQYNTAGTTLLSHNYIESVTGTQVTAQLATSPNCHVWFVANAGDLGAMATEALLNAKILPFAATADGRPQSNLLAMTHMWQGAVAANTASLPPPVVTLKRLAAKITFTYNLSGEGFTFTPTAVSLKNVPNCSQIGTLSPGNRPAGATYTTSYNGTISPAGATMYWYLPENMAGTAAGTNAVQSEKEKTGTGITNATYIELKGNATQSGVEYQDVTFRFYPGNGANDYNIGRNDHFTMKVDLKGLDISDKRITVGTIPEITESTTGNLPVTAGGTKEVNITSRAGVIWSLPLPEWLSATMNGQITPGGSTLTNQGPGKVTFTTATMNQTAEVRSQTYDIKLDDTRSQSFTIAQDASTLVVGPDISLAANAGAGGSSTFTATSGLPWNAAFTGDWLAWADDNPASSGTTTGGEQVIKVKAIATNPSVSSRTAAIEVRAGASVNDPAYTGLKKDINVTQAGSTLAISGATSVSIGAEASTRSFAFTATPGLNWTAGANVGWISLTGASSGTTPSGAVSVPYSVPLNPTTSERTGSITVRAGDPSNGPSGTINITQAGSVFNLSANVLNLYCLEATNSSITLTGTPGLAWTVSPSTETNGIAPQTTGGTANGSAQAITFHATGNIGVATRTAIFTVSVPGDNHSAKTITVNQEGNAVTINQDILTKYAASISSSTSGQNKMTRFPPFDTDNDGGSFIINKHGISFDLTGTPTMTGSYKLQVQSTQPSTDYYYYDTAVSTYPARDYCSTLNVDGHADWRLPTNIELYAMWDKAKGSNNSATDKEPDSRIFGAPFIGGIYWNSSVGNGDAGIRCVLPFYRSSFMHDDTYNRNYVRCVRDL